jgi:hypothetical protein
MRSKAQLGASGFKQAPCDAVTAKTEKPIAVKKALPGITPTPLRRRWLRGVSVVSHVSLPIQTGFAKAPRQQVAGLLDTQLANSSEGC